MIEKCLVNTHAYVFSIILDWMSLKLQKIFLSLDTQQNKMILVTKNDLIWEDSVGKYFGSLLKLDLDLSCETCMNDIGKYLKVAKLLEANEVLSKLNNDRYKIKFPCLGDSKK